MMVSLMSAQRVERVPHTVTVHMTSAFPTETPKMGLEQKTPTISFLDLNAQFAGIRDKVMAAIARVMESQSTRSAALRERTR